MVVLLQGKDLFGISSRIETLLEGLQYDLVGLGGFGFTRYPLTGKVGPPPPLENIAPPCNCFAQHFLILSD